MGRRSRTAFQSSNIWQWGDDVRGQSNPDDLRRLHGMHMKLARKQDKKEPCCSNLAIVHVIEGVPSFGALTADTCVVSCLLRRRIGY